MLLTKLTPLRTLEAWLIQPGILTLFNHFRNSNDFRANQPKEQVCNESKNTKCSRKCCRDSVLTGKTSQSIHTYYLGTLVYTQRYD